MKDISLRVLRDLPFISADVKVSERNRPLRRLNFNLEI